MLFEEATFLGVGLGYFISYRQGHSLSEEKLMLKYIIQEKNSKQKDPFV